MLKTHVFLALAILIAPSTGSSAKDDQSRSAATNEVHPSRNHTAPSGSWEKLVMHPFRDAQGTVIVEMPFPSTWKVSRAEKAGEPTIIGPHGIKIIDFPGQSFLHTSNPQMQQIYQQSGQRLRAMPGAEQIVRQDLAPWCAKQGLSFVREYEVPEVSKIDKWYNDQLYKVMPSEMLVSAIGTEWQHTDGQPYFILMHLVASTGGDLQTWYYSCTGLQAEKAHFEAAKKQLIFGLANAHYNPRPIMAYNQREVEKAGKSWAAHRQRMADNQAAFEASQRAFVNRSSAINDALMSGWRERNAAGDKAQERFIDTITERSNVIDPSTGTRYKVESGSNQYWMNRDGKYIGTDNPNYDPNLDKTLNEQSWQQLKNAD